MRLVPYKCFKQLTIVPRWSTLLPLLLYLVFISVILHMTFPLKSSKSSRTDDSSSQLAKDLKNLDDNGILEAEADDNENKLMEKANMLGVVENANDVLSEVFKKADLNDDTELSLQEVARFINKRMREHIELAIKNNPRNFAKIDVSPRDGLISWEEYHAHFLRTKGHDENYIEQHNEKKHVELDRKAKEQIMKDRALWNEAARTDSFSLTLDEFLAFRHPEASAANLLSLVDDLLRQFDEDGDEVLTLDEFSEVAADDLDDKWRKYMITKTVYQRREEFRRLIDKNKDGKGDRSELLSYVDPRHPRHALQEAALIFNLVDLNKDHHLAINELQRKANIILASKMVDTSESFHDDF